MCQHVFYHHLASVHVHFARGTYVFALVHEHVVRQLFDLLKYFAQGYA